MSHFSYFYISVLKESLKLVKQVQAYLQQTSTDMKKGGIKEERLLMPHASQIFCNSSNATQKFNVIMLWLAILSHHYFFFSLVSARQPYGGVSVAGLAA